MITITNHAASFFVSIIQIIAEHTSSLSASGSINFPKFVTRLYFLAIFPSRRSVKLATQNNASAIHLFAAPPTSVSIKNTKKGTINIRKTVNLFGRFILQFLLSDHIPTLRSPALLQNLPTPIPRRFLRRSVRRYSVHLYKFFPHIHFHRQLFPRS